MSKNLDLETRRCKPNNSRCPRCASDNETSPVDGDRYKYTGREWEPETGLYYYRARYYNATIMRFMSEDPLGFGAGDPNLSRYVNNNSPNATDPGGTIAFVPLLIWGGTALLISGLGYANVQYRVAAARYDNAFELGQGPLDAEREGAFQRELAAARWSHAQGNRGMGAAQIGGAMMTAGTAGSLFGLGSPIVGSLLAVNAVDNFQAGVRTLITGEYTQTGTEWAVSQGLQRLGVSRQTADIVGIAVNFAIPLLGGGYGAFRAWRVGRAGQAGGRAAPAGGPRQTFATGSEWYEHFAQRYGAQNVEWMSGSGRTITWPAGRPLPPGGIGARMFRVRPERGSAREFAAELESALGPRPPGGIAHHNQPLMLNGVDNGAINGSWQFNPAHQAGHDIINAQVLTPRPGLPYGTEIRIRP